MFKRADTAEWEGKTVEQVLAKLPHTRKNLLLTQGALNTNVSLVGNLALQSGAYVLYYDFFKYTLGAPSPQSPNDTPCIGVGCRAEMRLSTRRAGIAFNTLADVGAALDAGAIVGKIDFNVIGVSLPVMPSAVSGDISKATLESAQAAMNQIEASLVNARTLTPTIVGAFSQIRNPTERWWSAISSGDINEVRSLIASKAVEPNARLKDGYAALHFAADRDHRMVVSELLSNGADPQPKRIYGVTPLMQAALKGHIDVVRSICDRLQHDGKIYDIDTRDEGGRTALFYAAYAGQTSVVTELLKRGAQNTTGRHLHLPDVSLSCADLPDYALAHHYPLSPSDRARLEQTKTLLSDQFFKIRRTESQSNTR